MNEQLHPQLKQLHLNLHIVSIQRSAQVHLPEISVSSIEGLLQRVAERVGRRERKRDETSGLTNPDHLLMAGALQNLREKRLQHRGDYSSEYCTINSAYNGKVIL